MHLGLGHVTFRLDEAHPELGQEEAVLGVPRPVHGGPRDATTPQRSGWV